MLVLIRNSHLIIKYLPSSSPHLAARFLPGRRGSNSPECKHSSSLMWNLRPNLFSTSSSPFRGDKKNKGSFSSGAPNKSKGHQSKSPEGCVAFPVKSWQLLFALSRRADLAVLSACQFENLNKLNRHWLLKLQQISAFWNMAG